MTMGEQMTEKNQRHYFWMQGAYCSVPAPALQERHAQKYNLEIALDFRPHLSE
jgi:hypothetical protein